MLIRTLAPFGAILALVLIAPAALGHGVKSRTLEIVHPWTYGTNEKAAVPVYMKIKSLDRRGDRLIGAETAIAASVAIHQPKPGAASPNETVAAQVLAINGRSNVELVPSGARLVMKDIARPLRAYDTFEMTLVFERAGRIKVEVLVEER